MVCVIRRRSSSISYLVCTYVSITPSTLQDLGHGVRLPIERDEGSSIPAQEPLSPSADRGPAKLPFIKHQNNLGSGASPWTRHPQSRPPSP
jgi:hypothetical protein